MGGPLGQDANPKVDFKALQDLGPPLCSLFVPLQPHWPLSLSSHSVGALLPQGLCTCCCSLCLECSSSRNPHSLLLCLCSNDTSSVGPLSATPLQNTKPTLLGPPSLLCLLNFSPEASIILYHLLIYFVVYSLSPTK